MNAERLTPLVLIVLGLSCAGLVVFAGSDAGASPVLPAGQAHESAGQRLWHEHGCAVCHRIHRIHGSGGYLGSDLTHVVSRRGLSHLRAVLEHGLGDGHDFALSPGERYELLEHLKQVGRSKRLEPALWPGRASGD